MHAIFHRGHEHFEPEVDAPPAEQRQRKARLEAIDYAAFAANSSLLPGAVSPLDIEVFERLAVTTAAARSRWLSQGLALADARTPSPEAIAALAEARSAYEELAWAYEGLRRIVERGYAR
jgi:hypothetical protein